MSQPAGSLQSAQPLRTVQRGCTLCMTETSCILMPQEARRYDTMAPRCSPTYALCLSEDGIVSGEQRLEPGEGRQDDGLPGAAQHAALRGDRARVAAGREGIQHLARRRREICPQGLQPGSLAGAARGSSGLLAKPGDGAREPQEAA